MMNERRNGAATQQPAFDRRRRYSRQGHQVTGCVCRLEDETEEKGRNVE